MSTATIDEMRIAILEWQGWKIPDDCSHKNKSKGAPPPFGLRPGTQNDWTNLPEITFDWLHECEEKLDEKQQLVFMGYICDQQKAWSPSLLDGFKWCHSTTKQRLIALYKTVCR